MWYDWPPFDVTGDFFNAKYLELHSKWFVSFLLWAVNVPTLITVAILKTYSNS